MVVSAAELASYFEPEVVKPVFALFNTLLLLPWPLMIFFPNAEFTKGIIKSNVPLFIFIGFYAYTFAAATAQSSAAGADLGEQVKFLFTEAVAGTPPLLSQSHTPVPSWTGALWTPSACRPSQGVHIVESRVEPERPEGSMLRKIYYIASLCAHIDTAHLCALRSNTH